MSSFSLRSVGLGLVAAHPHRHVLVADLVIADISIHNANAFYELGARHAFREKRTFLLRCGKESLPPEANLRSDQALERALSSTTWIPLGVAEAAQMLKIPH